MSGEGPVWREAGLAPVGMCRRQEGAWEALASGQHAYWMLLIYIANLEPRP